MANRPLTTGAIGVDINQIVNTASLDPNAITYDIILNTVNTDLRIVEWVSLETSRDYANNVCDYRLLTIILCLGEYVKQIHPFLDNLEVTIVTHYYNTRYTDRYKAVIVSGVESIAGSIYTSYTESELNKLDKLVIELQCVGRLTEAIRLKPVSGIFSHASVKDVITTVMNNNITGVRVENTVVNTNLNFVQPNNAKTFRHINIPYVDNIRVLDLPTYIQNGKYGVYTADIGTYIQKIGYFDTNKVPVETLYIYPLYNTRLGDRGGRRLVILSSPTTILSQSENSYVIDGDVIKIIGSGDMHSSEKGQSMIIDNGESVVVPNPTSIMTPGVSINNSTITTARDKNVSGHTLVNRPDGVTGVNHMKPTSNIYKQYSQVARNALSPYHVIWNYSNPELLFPGMSVMYIYEDGDKGIVKLNGVIHSLFNKYNNAYKTHTTNINVLLESYVVGMANKGNSVDVRY